ncbi:Mu transposase C-terminal domain-containing protein [Catalinimonas sp. 4WD22]|uniref:Mu transposase C-terminal domain-containing protein n=1 Tax=Catalinimonas locisalis TaxID=3133978 RepID=UPI003100F888
MDQPRKVQREGIRFQGLRYLALPLSAFVGESVTIRYDPRDLAQIRVFHQQQFVCTAVCQDIAELTVSLKEIQKARKEVRQGLYQEIKRTKRLLKSIQQQKTVKEPPSYQKETLAEPNLLKRYEND